jgi:uncharacterized protein
MPEYLAPGVYVEEVSYRAKSIEGVATSTTGFAGMTRFGPVHYEDGPETTKPRLITSFTEFERVYGGLAPLELDDNPERANYMAHAVRAFFNNGGRRVYVSRVFSPVADAKNQRGHLTVSNPPGFGQAEWIARWPGADGNVLVESRTVRTKSLAFKFPNNPDDPLQKHTWDVQMKSIRAGAVVEISNPPAGPPLKDNAPLVIANLRVVEVDNDGRQRFFDSTGAEAPLPDVPNVQVVLVELRVIVTGPDGRVDSYEQLAAHPDQLRYIGKVLEANDPEDENAMVYLRWTPPGNNAFEAAALMIGLQGADKRLQDGEDGTTASPDDLAGAEALPDKVNGVNVPATGLEALSEIDDIAIVALPDGGALADAELSQAAADRLISHAERNRYRIAVVDAPQNSSITEIREFRGKFDSKYAALYHPWIEILDPLFPSIPGVPTRKLMLPPSGFVTGIYARNDVERGVHKAPANEVVRGLTKFEININKSRQDVLNPEGVNCLRFFEGRGSRVWGARTMSSDPEWKYVNVRRLFIYLEHSIDKATQWAVFEPNNERLWTNIRRSVEDFLYVLWRDGALIGAKPEEAFFVRCDRTTMTQNDLDNGRMICLVGVAPSRPAEFVIFRVGQWTADSKV